MLEGSSNNRDNETSSTELISKSNEVDEDSSDSEISSDDETRLGEYITKEYGILRSILSYLPMRDLRSAACVCRSWKEASEHEQSKRKKPDWTFWKRRAAPSVLTLVSEGFHRDTFCAPHLCLSFLTGHGVETHVRCGQSGLDCPCPGEGWVCEDSHCVCQYVESQVHPASCHILLEGDGVVGTQLEMVMGPTEEVEAYTALSTLLLPDVPDVNISTFRIHKPALRKLRQGSFSMTDLDDLITVDAEKSPLRCVLLFCNNDCRAEAADFLECLVRLQPEPFVIGGGFFNRAHYLVSDDNQCATSTAIMGVIFSGKSMRAASTILQSSVKTKSQVTEAMLEFSRCNLPEKNSIALMFACCGRGRRWYKQKNVESAAFRAQFPNTPLLGAFVQGEIGRKCFPDEAPEPQEEVAKRGRYSQAEELLHSYTTVFVHVSFGTAVAGSSKQE